VPLPKLHPASDLGVRFSGGIVQIRYIKLGIGGIWEQSCIETDGTIRLGYQSPLHMESLAGEWEKVRTFWLEARNGNKGAASRDLSQIRDFYERSEDDIWITFYKRKMYWCRAESEVRELQDGSRIRKVVGGWSCKSEEGNVLAIEGIDGRVTKVQAFRGTICDVSMPQYMMRKIRGELEPDVLTAKESLRKLELDVEGLIRGLWWKDFELLVKLVFSRAGWQRMSVVGKTEKEIDLDVVLPVSNRRAFVQVKSQTSPSEFKRCYECYIAYDQYNEMYMVFHSLNGEVSHVDIASEDLHLWDCSRLA
jgi:hypothetical protein